MLNTEKLLHPRMDQLDASGIRKVFDLAAKLENPINLSIGQPDFDVPPEIKQAAITAIQDGHNKYTQTQGIAQLRAQLATELGQDYPNWVTPLTDQNQVLVTSGVSGALLLLMLTCIGPGDEVIFADPYFVMYKHLVNLMGAKPVMVNTYPEFQLDAEKVADAITENTKLILFNSPGNPTGTVNDWDNCKTLAQIADQNGILLVSDEIYHEFCYEKSEAFPHEKRICPSPARYSENVLVLRGFSKTYAMTGWRLGYAAGPAKIIDAMAKLQQYSFVCAPSMAQFAGLSALDINMDQDVARYQQKRDYLMNALKSHYNIASSGGAFYLFPEVPRHLNMTGTQFVEAAIEKNLLVIPGAVFSEQDTHFRISYAAKDQTLEAGIQALIALAS